MPHLEQQTMPQSLDQMLAPQHQMTQQMTLQMMPQMAPQQPNMQDCMQMLPMSQDGQCPQMSQYTPVELPQMAVPQHLAPQMMSGESTPTDVDRCMAIVMPQAAQFPCDRDSMV